MAINDHGVALSRVHGGLATTSEMSRICSRRITGRDRLIADGKVAANERRAPPNSGDGASSTTTTTTRPQSGTDRTTSTDTHAGMHRQGAGGDVLGSLSATWAAVSHAQGTGERGDLLNQTQ
jgi:hypothetical protein